MSNQHVQHFDEQPIGTRVPEMERMDSSAFANAEDTDPATWQREHMKQPQPSSHPRDDSMEGLQHQQRTGSAAGRTVFTEERPLGVQPTSQGGVAVGGQEDKPMGHAKLTDKIVGKTEKVMGKMSKNPQMHEKGELREAGGKAAATGQARAPHD
ncbi:uncharacterized protein SCHCODRAFT_01216282 [Schizophyllum commune H4-8]|uniref:Uncharacterized protein n=1 Tax=Schizophyllum commune (strain H4-8 / FGSC 9210) TaxID=578458 RepID=D8QG68_SCHCM|nr:uncharacterized protein SCHCODRAFT_01216282 [Schizophyllum commune H4-8]KAI5887931.1 hypothetical protein SCHCODRAFT_01216282 [Schizophyllum commune H4-8]